jgi:type I restriction enzyme S subunit
MSRISSGSNTTTIKSIQLEVLRKLPIILPPIKEQQKISSFVSTIESAINSHYHYKSQLVDLKKGLMQKLLTGKIRVKV